MKTESAIQLFLGAKRAKGLQPRTLETYAYNLGVFARAHSDLPSAPEPIERFLESSGPSAETRATYYRHLRGFYRWLEKRGRIRRNPMDAIEAPLVPRKVARALTPGELAGLLGAKHNSTVRAFIWLLADTGLRISEALSIQSPSEIKSTVVVSGKTGEHEVPISPIVREMVIEALPWPWSGRQAAGLAVRRGFKKAGLFGVRASAQTLRHTFTRLWEGDETVLVGILGWSTTKMLRVYRPYDVSRAKRQHTRYSPIRRARP